MTRWGEIKCPRCEEIETNRDALIEQMRDLCQQIEAAARRARGIAIEVRKDTLAELRSDLPVDKTRESQKGWNDD